jgi:hypothetical protein
MRRLQRLPVRTGVVHAHESNRIRCDTGSL